MSSNEYDILGAEVFLKVLGRRRRVKYKGEFGKKMDEDYKKFWKRPNKDLLHEVLEKTINLDMLVFRIIRKYFDLELKLNESHQVVNLEKIENFTKFFLSEMGSLSKFQILEKIETEQAKTQSSKLEKLKTNFLRIYEIRNIFAHHPVPKKSTKKYLATPEEISWEELHEKHKKLCEEITSALIRAF